MSLSCPSSWAPSVAAAASEAVSGDTVAAAAVGDYAGKTAGCSSEMKSSKTSSGSGSATTIPEEREKKRDRVVVVQMSRQKG